MDRCHGFGYGSLNALARDGLRRRCLGSLGHHCRAIIPGVSAITLVAFGGDGEIFKVVRCKMVREFAASLTLIWWYFVTTGC